MLFDVVYLAVLLFTVGSALAVFISGRLVHSVMALAAAFAGSALLFFSMGQPFIALLQFFVFVGGLSTYLMVALAAEERESAHHKNIYLLLLAVILGLGFYTLMGGTGFGAASGSSQNIFMPSVESLFSGYMPFLYMIALLLGAGAIGSVLVIRSFIRLVV